jgi:hypothetical protein
MRAYLALVSVALLEVSGSAAQAQSFFLESINFDPIDAMYENVKAPFESLNMYYLIPAACFEQLRRDKYRSDKWLRQKRYAICTPYIAAARPRVRQMVQMSVQGEPVQPKGYNYAFNYFNVYDPHVEMVLNAGLSIPQGVLAATTGPIGIGVNAVFNTGRCTDRDARRQLQEWARADIRARKWWSKENAEANVQQAHTSAFPYCIPVIGGLLNAKDAVIDQKPIGVIVGLANSFLDLVGFGLPVGDSISTPVSYGAQAGTLVQRVVDRAEQQKQKTAEAKAAPRRGN